jgi:hypothetical protein
MSRVGDLCAIGQPELDRNRVGSDDAIHMVPHNGYGCPVRSLKSACHAFIGVGAQMKISLGVKPRKSKQRMEDKLAYSANDKDEP